MPFIFQLSLMLRPKKSCKKSAFLLKTYDMLNNQSFSHILDWNLDGVGFLILDPERFADTVLPAYFKHSNFPSFIRQLNMYGFSKKRTAKNESYYFHPKFRRDQKQLIAEIPRRVEKKTAKHAEHDDHTEMAKIPSEISIELQSRQNKLKTTPQATLQETVCFDFYNLMNINQTMLHQQISAIVGILADARFLSSESDPVYEEAKTTLLDYAKAHTSFQNNLLQKTRQQIKGSQKFIGSSLLLETRENLNILQEDHFMHD